MRALTDKADAEKRELTAEENDQYLWPPGLVADRPDTILDLLFFMSEYAPNTFTTGLYVGIIGAIALLYGPRVEPLAKDATVKSIKTLISPDEGTA
jgi:hypothetical protein